MLILCRKPLKSNSSHFFSCATPRDPFDVENRLPKRFQSKVSSNPVLGLPDTDFAKGG
jgi:hypothetical protein